MSESRHRSDLTEDGTLAVHLAEDAPDAGPYREGTYRLPTESRP